MQQAVMSPLYEELRSLEVKTADPDNRRFIPQNALERILTESAIKHTLAKTKPEENFYMRPELIQGILGGGKKLFSVLILIKREDAISKFLEKDHLQALDSRLPFKLDDGLIAMLGNQGDAEKFYEAQWKVIAPLLQHERSHRAFDPMTVLPFIQCENLKGGGFGTISRVTLCPSHQLLVTPGLDGKAIAIRKKISSTGPSNPENEERILASLRVLKHRNIIALLASYSYRGAHYLLFPPADGDLEALLQGKIQLPPNFHQHTVLREVHGLSSAIETVHKFFIGEYDLTMIGCHYDLKPKNILVKGGKFLLTDFGLSRLKPKDTAPSDGRLRVEGFYYAPETQSIQDGFKDPTAGPEADVWSFGCILAMILIFLQYGSEGVGEFDTSRRIQVDDFITRSFHVNGQLNPAVPKWLETTNADLRGMVGLIQRQLNIDPTKRPRMPDVTDELFFLAQQRVFEFSRAKFWELLVQTGQPIDLEIEGIRYMIWGKTAGFTRGYSESQKAVISHFRGSSSEVINALVEIEDELHFIETWSTRSLKPRYFRLRRLNDKLYAHLPPQLADEGNRVLESAMLDGKTSTQLRNISDAFQNDVSPEYNGIGKLAKFKHLMTEVDKNAADTKPADNKPVGAPNPVDTNPDEHDGLLLKDSDVSATSLFHVHSLGTVISEDGPEPVLIEWVTYGPHWDDKLYARVPKIAKLFSKLIKLECSSLRVLACRGYFRDRLGSRYGLVYKIPTPSPITLRQLIRDTNERSKRPPLGDLFELARKIVHCVLEVHKVGWIHRSISSYNIIFLPSTPLEPIPVTSPYLIGFSHSRREDPQTFTAGMSDDTERQYYHPDYLQDEYGFRPEHDFYSVGLVLLEIGRWRPLNQLTRRLKGLTLKARSDALVKECMDNLANSMGVHYCDAVRACLTTDFTLGHGAERMRNEFETKVVNRLAGCQA